MVGKLEDMAVADAGVKAHLVGAQSLVQGCDEGMHFGGLSPSGEDHGCASVQQQIVGHG